MLGMHGRVAFGAGTTAVTRAIRRLASAPAVAVLLGAVVALLPGATVATPAALAQAPIPFNCTSNQNFLSQQGTLLTQGFGAGDSTFDPINPAFDPGPNPTVNAIGFREQDGFIYSMIIGQNNPLQGQIGRIGADGRFSLIGPITGWPAGQATATGTVGPDGVYYLAQGGITRVNVTTNPPQVISVTPFVPSGGLLGPDWTFKDGYLWTVGGGGTDGTDPSQVSRINPTTGQVEIFDAPAINPPGPANGLNGVGAMFTYANGNLGAGDNDVDETPGNGTSTTGGAVYEIKVNNSTSANPTFELVSRVTTPETGNNDGASCRGLPVDLRMDKSVTPAGPVTPGSAISYTLRTTNAGPGGVNGYTISDTIPAGIGNPATTSPGCAIANRVLTCTLGVLTPSAPGNTSTVTVTGTAPATFGTCVTNTATVSPQASDSNLANNTDSVDLCTTPAPDLVISKRHAPGTFTAGGTGSFTLTARNNAATPTTNAPVTVTDTLPAGLVPGTPTGTGWTCGAPVGQGISCTRSDVRAGQTDYPDITVPVSVAPSAAGTLVNTARVDGGGEANTANNTGSDSVVVARDFDVSVTKTLLPGPLRFPGDSATFRIVVASAGPGDSPTIGVADTVPAGLTITGVTGACNALPCTLPGIAAGGAPATIDVTTAIAAAGTAGTTQTNTVTVTPNGDGDRVAANNTSSAGVPVAGRPDLTIDKSVNAPAVAAGGTGTFTLVATNATTNANGTPTSGTVTVTDTAPAGISFGTPTGAGWTCGTQTAAAISCTRTDSRNPGDSFEPISLPFQAAADQTGLRTNTAVVGGGGETNTTNNSDSADVTIQRRFDVRVAKSASPTTLLPGDTTTFTVTVTNAGPSVSDAIALDETFPAGLVLGNVTSSPGVTCNAAADCTIPSLAVGANATVQLQGTAPADVLTGSTQTNTVTIDPGPNDTNTGNHTAQAVVTVQGVPRIQARKRATSTQVRGSTATYEVETTNIGGAPTTAPTTVTDPMPTGLTAVSAVGTGWDCTGTTATQVSCVRPAGDGPGPLPPITILVRVALDAPASITNRVTSNNCGPCPPPPPVLTEPQDQFDLSITKAASATPVRAGADVTYTLTVRNAGPSNATAVSVDETLPPGIVLKSTAPSQGTCDAAGDCTLGTVGPNGTATITVVGTAQLAQRDTDQTNVATVTAGNIAGDVQRNNERDQATVRIVAPDLRLTKSHTGDLVRGTDVTYSLVVRNDGTATAVGGGTFTDPLPTGLTNGRVVSAPGWDCAATTPQAISCKRTDDLLVNTPYPTIQVAARVALDAPASVTNTGSIDPVDPFDPPGGDTGIDVGDVKDDFDLSITKSVPVSQVRAGSDVTYTLTVANAGPSNAVGVTVDETLPAGIVLKSATPSQGTCNQTTGDCTLGIVGPNGTVTITVVGTAQLAQRDTDQVNVATVASTNVTDRLRTNERATASVRIIAQDLQPEKTADAKFVRGTDASYEITVTNRGSAIAVGGGGFDDPVPAGIQNPVGTGTGWTCTTLGQLVKCDRTNPADTLLPNTAWPVVTITGRVALNAPASVSNTVTVRPGDPFDVPDVPFTPVVRSPVSEVDVSIDKTAAPGTILATQRTTFTMVVRNLGPSIAENVVMTDTLPAGFVVPDPEGDIVTTTKGTCSAGPAYSCDLGDMQPGTTETITIVAEAANAKPPAETTVTNTARVATSTTDTAPANNVDTADVKVDRTNDLLTVKTKVTDPVIAGDFVDFEILVTNLGPSDALNTRVEDVIPAVIDPATVTITSSVPATCAVTADRTKVGCDIPQIDNGKAALIKFRGKLFSDTFAKKLSNTACAINPNDPKTANNCSTTPEDDIEERSDVSVVKTGPKTVKADGTITYTLKVSNAGPSDAAQTVLTDTLPEGTTFVSIDPSCPVAAGVVTCAVGTLKPAETRTYTVVVDTQLQQAELVLTNKAQVKARPEDPTPGNNTSIVETKVDPASNLSIVKTGPATVNAELPLVYTLTVRNAGPSTSGVTTVTDVLPGDVQFVTAGPSQGQCSVAGQTLTCQLGPIASGGVATILVTTTPAKSLSGITVKNRATVAGSNDDPNPGDNGSEVDTLVKPPLPDLKVSKALRGGTPRIGETLSYRITAENVGNGPATDAVITDTLPAGLQFVSAKPSVGSCAGKQVLRCAVGTIAAKARVTIDLEAKVVKTGEITNVASGVSAEADLNPSDNVASTTANGKALVNPVLRKITSSRAAVRGGTVPYTITFRNPGAGTLRNVKVCDRMPEGLTYVKATPRPKLSSGRVCWTIKAIASGSSTSFRVTGRVDSDARGSRLTNRVSASGAGMKPVTAQATRPLQGVKSARANGVTG